MYKILVYLVMIGLAACSVDSNKNIDREKIRQEMKDREIKRVSEPELMDAAFRTGADLVGMADDILSKKLEGFYDSIVSNTNNQDKWVIHPPVSQVIMPVLDSLSQLTGHSVALFSLKLKGLYTDTLDVEKQLLEAYQYNIDNELTSEDNVQRLGTDQLLFTRPVTSKSSICFPALVEEVFDKAPDTLGNDRSVYFCGMWSIRLSKRLLVRSL